MKALNKITCIIASLLIVILQFFFQLPTPKAYAATSPTLGESSSYSVLGGAGVTNTGTTTTNGAVGVSPGTSITGGATLTAGGGTHSNDASAIAAQADITTATTGVWDVLDQSCDHSYGAQDLTAISPLVPGVYCSTSSFSLSGNLTLTGSTGVWIFKSVSTLITSSGSSVTGGDPCNVWWRVGSSVTLGTTTSFIGNILALNGVNAMNTGATLDGRLLVLAAGTVTLAGNTITGPTCSASPTATPTPTPTASSSSSSGGSSSTSTTTYPALASTVIAPTIIESKRVGADSIFISWGPYSGIDTFIVQYGLENGKWLYNTKVTGFSTTLKALPLNQPIWVQVAAYNGTIGNYGVTKLVGGPKLSNAGFASHKNSIPWYISASIGVVVLTLLILIKRKHKFS